MNFRLPLHGTIVAAIVAILCGIVYVLMYRRPETNVPTVLTTQPISESKSQVEYRYVSLYSKDAKDHTDWEITKMEDKFLVKTTAGLGPEYVTTVDVTNGIAAMRPAQISADNQTLQGFVTKREADHSFTMYDCSRVDKSSANDIVDAVQRKLPSTNSYLKLIPTNSDFSRYDIVYAGRVTVAGFVVVTSDTILVVAPDYSILGEAHVTSNKIIARERTDQSFSGMIYLYVWVAMLTGKLSLR